MKMTICEYEKAKVERFIERWKESGYEIEYNVIKGGKPVDITFTNKEEGIPCHFLFHDGRIICYGDYSAYVWRQDWGGIGKLPLNSIRYFLSKSTAKREFDDDFYSQWRDGFKEEVRDWCVGEALEMSGYDDYDEAFDKTIGDSPYNGYDFARKMDGLFEAIGCLDDASEYYDECDVYPAHALAQVAMLRLITEDWNEKKEGLEKEEAK